MPRKRKYSEGSIVGPNSFELVRYTAAGNHPKALFRYPSGEEREHRIADVEKGAVNGSRVTNRSLIYDFKPGDLVGSGDYKCELVRVTKPGGRARAIFRHPDGHEAEHRIFDIWSGLVAGYRQPARTYSIGDAIGEHGLVLASLPRGGKAVFKYPDGWEKAHYVADVERGAVTGRPKGRPKGTRNNWLKITREGPEARQRRLAQNDYRREWRNKRDRTWHGDTNTA